jgi:hypothetical protein
MKLTGPACTEALNEAEEAERREGAEDNAGGVRVELRVRPIVNNKEDMGAVVATSALFCQFTRLLGSVVSHSKSLALIVTIFLVRIIECFKECFLLMRSIFLNLRLWQITNRFVWHSLSPPRP